MGSSVEDVLLMVNHVRHKKSDGTLYLMGERVAWMLDGKDTFPISLKYADIKMQKISPEGKPKIQLQVVLNSGEATTFHFINPLGSEAQLKDRNDIKELLQQLLPKFRPKVNKELEEKNRILQENPELFQLYRDLVISQVISAEEFWANHAGKAKIQTDKKPQQEVGVSAAFLADIKPQTDGCNGLKYNITADIIESIFKTYPAVKRKHMENVPHKLTESEFWTRFFQSHYFHRDRLNLGTKDLFSECTKNDEQDIRIAMKESVTEPLVNLNNFEDNNANEDTDSATNANKNQSTRDANQSMIRRFNHHSMMVLQACKARKTLPSQPTVTASKPPEQPEKSNPSATPVVNGKLDKKEKKAKAEALAFAQLEEMAGPSEEEIRLAKKVRLQEKTEYEDLAVEAESSYTPLTLTKVDRYLQGPIPIENSNLQSSEDVFHSREQMKEHVEQWNPNLTQVLTSSGAVSALSELSRGGTLMASSHQVPLKETTPQEIQKELRHLYSALCELLRHFWACFPTTTPQLEEKVYRMKSTLERFQYAKLQPFHDQLLREHCSPELTTHLTHMLEAAYNKFNVWKSKRANMPRK